MIQLSPISMFSLLVWIVALGGLVWWGKSFRHQQRNLMGNLKPWITVSAVFITLSVASLAFKGLNYGLDFTGGTILELAVYKQTSVGDVQAALAAFDSPKLGDQLVQVGNEMVPDPADPSKSYQRVVIRVTREVPLEDGSKHLRNDEPKALQQYLNSKLGENKQLRIASIGPTVTGELKRNAFLAVGVAMLAQAFYIFLRFGMQWRYGIAADIAIVHDVIIMVGLYALAGRQLDSPFVAALLTVAGYSVMDSVVIFDRIRENMNNARNRDFEQVVNESVNQTMTRSINTTMTVLITLLSIYFLGGTTLQNFAFALLCGIVSGAYSSVFVAAPCLVIIERYWSKSKKDISAPVRSDASSASTDAAAEAAAQAGEDKQRRRRRGGARSAAAKAETES